MDGYFYLLLCLFVASITCRSVPCVFQFQEAKVVGYGELMSYPGLWNNEGSTVMVVDHETGNALLYPQMAPYAQFFDNMMNKTHIIDATSEVFMYMSAEGKHLWTAKAYSTTFPVVDQDVYIINEKKVEKLSRENGQRLWDVPLCESYTASQSKQVSDAFNVVHGDSKTELAVGLLMTGSGYCAVTLGSEKRNLTSDHPDDNTMSTPYILYLSKADGQAVALEKFESMEADLVRSALRKDNRTTFLGMLTSNKAASIQRIVQYQTDGKHRWTTSLVTPHPHNFLWSQSFADDSNDHVLFISDPTEYMQINKELFKHKGLVFGGININTGAVAWKKTVPYSGIITSTFIQFMDENLVLLGAIWDGEDDLDLGSVVLHKLRRPVQGMLGFFAVFDVVSQTFLFVQEVAPEMAYPGHHVGLYKRRDGSYQIYSCPAFWDESPQRLVDNDNSVRLPRPDTDSVVLVRYQYTPCHGTSGTSQRGRHGQAAQRLGHIMVVFISLVFFGGILAAVVLFLKKQGFTLPSLGMPSLFGRAGRGYGFLNNQEDEDEDPFHDIDYENDPL